MKMIIETHKIIWDKNIKINNSMIKECVYLVSADDRLNIELSIPQESAFVPTMYELIGSTKGMSQAELDFCDFYTTGDDGLAFRLVDVPFVSESQK